LLNARLLLFLCLPVFLAASSIAVAQREPSPQTPLYGRSNSFGLLFAYSNDSSHIIMGYAEQRKLLQIGVSYSRKLILNRYLNWQYDAEFLPVALESDPLTKYVNQQILPTQQTTVFTGQPPMLTCAPQTLNYDDTINGVTYQGTATLTCSGRQWTIGQAISPIGMRWNFRTTHPVQPFISGHGGYMYSTHPIPVESAGSFNFTFDFGAGVEWYRTPRQSMRFEWRFHHISDHDTTIANPGIDNGVFQFSYVFGR
jgi:opacity protein-like surface antigen